MAQIRLDDAGTIRSQHGEPTWEVAGLFPRQGEWTIDEYLNIEFDRGAEYDSGRLEFLPASTERPSSIARNSWFLSVRRAFSPSKQAAAGQIDGLKARRTN